MLFDLLIEFISRILCRFRSSKARLRNRAPAIVRRTTAGPPPHKASADAQFCLRLRRTKLAVVIYLAPTLPSESSDHFPFSKRRGHGSCTQQGFSRFNLEITFETHPELTGCLGVFAPRRLCSHLYTSH